MIGVGMNMEYGFFENDLGLGFVFRFWDLGLRSTSIWDLAEDNINDVDNDDQLGEGHESVGTQAGGKKGMLQRD
ncbi:hypothetical protein F2Q69_00001599 [Brassica cretica]|uniref:Uncharacterized protein n=1 Tax=Brassica cretica TaxID=69181 RepID=A0A8S9PLY6_BRACR|nr:hypothetical protein F2Q69_00001599 [Brassica cretica]